jgi:hypothetical protein
MFKRVLFLMALAVILVLALSSSARLGMLLCRIWNAE